MGGTSLKTFLLLLTGVGGGGSEHAVGSWENRPLRPCRVAAAHFVCVVVVRWGGGCLCVSLAGSAHGSYRLVGCVGGCLVVDHGFFIVDASIWTSRLFPCGGGCGVLCDFCFECFLCYPTRAALAAVVVWGGVSVQERMVDALASGADEGRGNLR